MSIAWTILALSIVLITFFLSKRKTISNATVKKVSKEPIVLEPKDADNCKTLVVFLNPNSGHKRATNIFEKEAKDILLQNNFKLVVYETQYDGHATDIARSLQLEGITALVSISGDGMLSEVVNGLGQRADRESALKIPISIIPAGTGNGLASSLRTDKPKDAIKALINGQSRPLDMLLVDTQHNGRKYGFLSVSFGCVADYDYLTEKQLRWMGPKLSVAYAPVQVIGLNRTYRAKISMLLADPVVPSKPVTKQNLFECDPACECVTHKPVGSLSSDGPWTVIEDDISLFIATNVPKVAYDIIASPRAHFSDGLIDICLGRRSKMGRINTIRMFIAAETGQHINLSCVEYYKCRAFKLEPILEKGKPASHMSVDGQLMECQKISVEVDQGVMKIIHPYAHFLQCVYKKY